MAANKLTIERLFKAILRERANDQQAHALNLATELESEIGEPNRENISNYLHEWILIFEVRGELQEAIDLSAGDLAVRRAQVQAGDYELYPALLLEQIEYLQDGHYLQGIRYHKLANKEMAIKSLQEVYKLAEQYGIGPDEDVQSLFTELNS